MALPIKETPVLKGRDAARFMFHVYKSDTKPITKKERQDYAHAKELFERVQKNNADVF